jgi:hypothetical protein
MIHFTFISTAYQIVVCGSIISDPLQMDAVRRPCPRAVMPGLKNAKCRNTVGFAGFTACLALNSR